MYEARQQPRTQEATSNGHGDPDPFAGYQPLSTAEETLITSTAKGEKCDLLARHPDDENARVIRSALFRALCLRADAVDPKGIMLIGAVFRDALSLRDTDLCFGMEFLRCTFEQGVDVNGATIRYLGFQGCTVRGPFNVWHSRTEYSLILTSASDGDQQPFVATGPVNINSAKIGGQLACNGAKLRYRSGSCLSLYSAEIARDVYLTPGFEAGETVYMLGAKLRGSLLCNGGSFHSIGKALVLQQANIADRFVWNPEQVQGHINLTNAHAGVLEDEYALRPPRNLWEDIRHWGKDRLIELCFGLYRLKDERKERYLLEGFTYNFLARDMPKHGSEIVRWLLLADKREYHAQPFEQMARVLREGGHDAEAREVAIGKRIQRRRSYKGFFLWRGLRQFFEFWLLDIPIRYGYRPWLALVFAVAIWGFAAFHLDHAYQENVMVPASHDILPSVVQNRDATLIAPELAKRKARLRQQAAAVPKGAKLPPSPDWEAEEKVIAHAVTATPEQEKPALKDFVPAGYPHFNARIYALDEFLPIIELHQVEYWIPDRARPGGGRYWVLLWCVCISGWYLSTLFVSAFTGLIKSE